MKYKFDEKANKWVRLRKLFGKKCKTCLNLVECRLLVGCPPEETGEISRLLKLIARAINESSEGSCQDLKLAVHPFSVTDGLYLMDHKGEDYGKSCYHRVELAQWQKDLADSLWDGIPGMSSLFFTNGEIHIRHSGCFSNNELESEALKIIKPYLQRELETKKKPVLLDDWDWNKKQK